MSYVVESGGSPSRRARRRRALITLGVVALMLFFAFWYAYSYYRSDPKATASPTPSCTTTTKALTPASVTVNVYNATDRNGLAAGTATAVRKRGFKVSTVSNDPLNRTVTGVAEVRYGKSGRQQATLVLTLVKGAKSVPDGRTDTTVDLVLGDKFRALTAAPKKAATPTGSATTTRPAC